MVDQSASAPQLLLLATGGTIAGRAANSTSLNAYTAGTMAGSELLQELPQLQEVAQIQVEQLTNLDSADLQFQHWIQLVKRIRGAFAESPDLAGVYFFHLSGKRIIRGTCMPLSRSARLCLGMPDPWSE